MVVVCDCGFLLVDQLPYSSALVPSVHHALPHLNRKNKIHSAGNQYCSDNDVISVVDDIFGLTGRKVLQQWDQSYTRSVLAIGSML